MSFIGKEVLVSAAVNRSVSALFHCVAPAGRCRCRASRAARGRRAAAPTGPATSSFSTTRGVRACARAVGAVSEIPDGPIESRAARARHFIDRFPRGILDRQHDLRPRRCGVAEYIAEKSAERRVLSGEETVADSRAFERRFDVHTRRTRRDEHSDGVSGRVAWRGRAAANSRR